MAERLHQISKREGRIERVPNGQTPIIELMIEEGRRVVSVDLQPVIHFGRTAEARVTTDWRYTVYLDNEL